MFKLELASILLLLLLAIIITVQSKDSANDNHKNESSNFFASDLKENKHRIGFELFFYATNMFIDNFFEPKIPKGFNNIINLFNF